MFIDTHCHLSRDDYDDIEEVVLDNRNAGIDKIIISGCTKESIVESLDICNQYSDVYVTIGYHPSETDIVTDSDLELLEKQINHPKVVGIGEIGLDYHYGKENLEKQKDLFHKQLKLAEKHQLPVVIHSRDATQDTINLLKEFPNVKGIIHCFSGSLETAKIYISIGYYLGIGGVITFRNSKLSDVIKEIGLTNIVLETDSPYLTPEPNRGKTNSSKYILDIAKYIAKTLNTSIDDVSKITLKNTSGLFDFNRFL